MDKKLFDLYSEEFKGDKLYEALNNADLVKDLVKEKKKKLIN